MTVDKKKIPKLRFPGFEGEWEEKRLGEVAEITMGQSPKSENYTDNPNDYILVQGNADLINGKVCPRVWTKEVTKLADVGNIIFTVRAPVGEIGITEYRVVLGRGVCSIKGGSFIYYSMEKLKEISYWRKISTGSTFDSINSTELFNAIIQLPSLPEQEKIGNFFSNLDQLIEAQENRLETLEEEKRAYLQKMFPQKGEKVPQVRFQGFEGEWEEKRLGEVGESFSGLSGKSKEDFGHGEARYVSYLNVFKNPIVDKSMLEKIEIDMKQNEVLKGDILFTISSEIPEEVGMSSVCLFEEKNIYLNSFCFGFRPKIRLNLFFIAIYLRSPIFRKNIILLAQGISRYNISKIKVMDLTIQIPSLPEQEKIGNFFQLLDQRIQKEKDRLSHLRDLKRGLLQQMFI